LAVVVTVVEDWAKAGVAKAITATLARRVRFIVISF
jgi:hypothetical protein